MKMVDVKWKSKSKKKREAGEWSLMSGLGRSYMLLCLKSTIRQWCDVHSLGELNGEIVRLADARQVRQAAILATSGEKWEKGAAPRSESMQANRDITLAHDSRAVEGECA